LRQLVCAREAKSLANWLYFGFFVAVKVPENAGRVSRRARLKASLPALKFFKDPRQLW